MSFRPGVPLTEVVKLENNIKLSGVCYYKYINIYISTESIFVRLEFVILYGDFVKKVPQGRRKTE